MRILYFSQFYRPENMAAAFRATEHASYWHEWGHDVTVFTGWPNYPTRKLFPGYEMRLFEESSADGVRLLRSKQIIGANTSLLRRAINDGSYLAYGIWNGLTKGKRIGRDYDVVLASSGTIFNGLLGAWYAKRIGVPLVIEFRDLTYKQMVATGSPEDGHKVRLIKWLELALCKGAAAVVVLTDGFERTLASEGVPTSKMEVIPNGADVVGCGHDWSDRLRLGYFGTMGLSQEVTRNVRYAKVLHDRDLLESYELIGEGAAFENVEDIISSEGYDFVSLNHGIPKDQLEAHYAE
ncbi:MAG: glycosyltransferase family 4 protein, partial [Atopobiaceae bacterium]|nr:glycosyltransferase family 4 protein [Atopobiaceae bacterium]